jgi:hypothetical protein
MTRVTYKRHADGLLLSNKPLFAIDKFVSVQIDDSKLIATIAETKGPWGEQEVVFLKLIDDAKTLPALKSAVKRALKELGVVFQEEVRPRFKTELKEQI